MADDGCKVLMVFFADVLTKALEVDGDSVAGRVWEVFVEGAGHIGGELKGGIAGDAVIDVVAKGERQDQGGIGGGGLLNEGFGDFGEGSVFRVDGHIANYVGRAV